MTIIGARTSIGKSAFTLQLAWDIASQGIPVLFLSLEMYEEDITERLFCLTQKVNNTDLLKGKFRNYHPQWQAFVKLLEGKPLVITDMIGKTWDEVDKYLTFLTTKPKVIFIDHLQEARSALLKNQKEIIEEYLKKLRLMAIRDNIAIVICSQINRSSQEEKIGAEPQLHHLKSSGYIEEGADIIILLHWPYHYTNTGDRNKFILNVAKNRNGRTGWINIKYMPEHYLFYEEPEEL
jgi:replicative DNA helicase